MTSLRTDGKDRCLYFLHKWYATSRFVHNISSSELPITTTITFHCRRCSAMKTKDYKGKVFISFGEVIPEHKVYATN